jgi:hypothetical protein
MEASIAFELLLVPHRWPTYCQLVAAAISNVLKSTQMLKVVVMLRSLQHITSLDELVRRAMKVSSCAQCKQPLANGITWCMEMLVPFPFQVQRTTLWYCHGQHCS